MIKKVNGQFIISPHHVWLPGAYDTERTARYAFRFLYQELQALQDKANEKAGGSGGVITYEDLQGLRKSLIGGRYIHMIK